VLTRTARAGRPVAVTRISGAMMIVIGAFLIIERLAG
jgi:hypothetical protein